MENENLLNQFIGQVSPIKKRWSHPPVYKSEMKLGDTGKGSYTTFRFWIHEPTFQFPRTMVFASLNNKTSTYIRFNSMLEFDSWCDFIADQRTKMKEAFNSLAGKEALVQQARDQYYKQMETIESVKAFTEMQNMQSDKDPEV